MSWQRKNNKLSPSVPRSLGLVTSRHSSTRFFTLSVFRTWRNVITVQTGGATLLRQHGHSWPCEAGFPAVSWAFVSCPASQGCLVVPALEIPQLHGEGRCFTLVMRRTL